MTVLLRAALYLRVSTARQARSTMSPFRVRSGRARPIASRAAVSSSRPMSNPARRPPTTDAPSSSA
jgi:hypothetical protein